MTYRVTNTRRVERELEKIASWYFERSGSQDVADAWILSYRAAASTLEKDPERHPLAREDVSFDFEVRELLFGSGRKKTHRILFRIDKADSSVVVVGVRHVAQRDFTAHDL
jgi:plasmid stabilization system protein ParE